MGCTTSNETDPNIMYGSKNRPQTQQGNNYNFSSIPNGGLNSKETSPKKNGLDSNNKAHPESDSPSTKDKSLKNGVIKPPAGPDHNKGNLQANKTMKGDLSLYNEAKVHRERKLKERLMKRERLAMELSDRIMEEHERLSLTSSRSRATSRATSPRQGRANFIKPVLLSPSPPQDAPSTSNQNAPSTSTSNQIAPSTSHDHNLLRRSKCDNNNDLKSDISVGSAGELRSQGESSHSGLPNIA